ncbi:MULTISPECIES: S-layer homology domain-containing protein [Bacillus cereus group]|uniref:S-layer homology domain-containing protein n=1 Tax=Bacillus cereus group TaxID=86661 RepID=UPI000BEC0BD0|nr:MULTISPECIES: S-layer homology domain-containing protein [Bacillus cereus group]PDY96068.1 cell surface protein [Bacillus thuringiensis]PEQ79799.1 cell surface protein [Bacillus cereus]PEX31837.1 cell surface protein [Bacillus cereus]PFM11797.1 cell surface protein [Bacillus cereus]
MFNLGTIKESMKKLIYLEEQTMANKFLKTATALTIMGTSLLGAGAFTAKADNTDSLKFNDVPANHWSTKAIYDLTNRKVVQGYGNNIFGFGDNVTRGQVARMIYMYVKPADADASFKNPFTDIKGHLFEKEIRALAKAGLVNGFGDGKYGPDDILTREQMAQVLTNAFKFKATKTTSFTDIDKNSWALKAISALEENGVTIGTGGNMYSPYTHVTREQYSQFLYNSINAVEKETKPEVKPDPKPETKPEVPEGLDVDLVQPDFKYHPEGLKNSNIQPHLTLEAQNLVKEINKKYNTNLKYKDLQGSVHMMDTGMYYPEGSYIGGQFVVYGDKNDLDLTFLDNNPATVELTKRWITYVTGLNLDKEIQETVDADSINNYEKGNYKIRVGQTMVKDMMYVQIKAN